MAVQRWSEAKSAAPLNLLIQPQTIPAMMPLPCCVYILFSRKDHLLYIGFSTNLQNRINDHNAGKTRSTASRLPLELIFCEFYMFKQVGLKREKYFKTAIGKKALKLMLNGTLEKLGYKNLKVNY
jgi:putative endonuclease